MKVFFCLQIQNLRLKLLWIDKNKEQAFLSYQKYFIALNNNLKEVLVFSTFP